MQDMCSQLLRRAVRIEGTPGCLSATRMRFARTLDSSPCFEVFASERARATFPQLDRSFSGSIRTT